MIIVRTPLRISLAGGGCDLPVWYKTHGAMFIAAAIDKYIYTTFHHSAYDEKIRIRYSKMEEVDNVDEIQNEIVRETLKFCGIKDSVEITSHAEIPSGTGLGSSGSFGVGILQSIETSFTKDILTKFSTQIQMEKLKWPIGWQDQLVATYGGLRIYEIKNDDFELNNFKGAVGWNLETKLVMFYTGIKREANKVLKQSTTEGLDKIQELAWQTKKAFEKGNLDEYGEILKEHWEYKKKRGGMTNPQIDEWYELGLKNGALGGKLIGAGGGGFLLFYTNDREKLINSMPLLYQPFKFDYEGSKVIHNSND